MSTFAYTAEDLIESVRNLGMVPAAGTLGGNDSDILRHINEYFRLYLIPRLIDKRQEYYVVTTRIALSGTQLKYRLPQRAVGETLRMIRYVDSGGAQEDEPLPEIIPERQGDYSWKATGRPSGWYLEGNYICLVATSVTGYLEISWFFRPGQIVLSSEARQITAIDSVNRTVDSATAFPSSWSTGSIFDVHSFKSGGEIKVWDKAITALSSTAPFRITFADAIDGSIQGTHPIEVGDWICLAGEAAIPALPVDLHPLLVEAATVRMMAALGRPEAVKTHAELMKAAEESVMGLLGRRTEGRARRLVGRRGLLWRQRRRR